MLEEKKTEYFDSKIAEKIVYTKFAVYSPSGTLMRTFILEGEIVSADWIVLEEELFVVFGLDCKVTVLNARNEIFFEEQLSSITNREIDLIECCTVRENTVAVLCDETKLFLLEFEKKDNSVCVKTCKTHELEKTVLSFDNTPNCLFCLYEENKRFFVKRIMNEQESVFEVQKNPIKVVGLNKTTELDLLKDNLQDKIWTTNKPIETGFASLALSTVFIRTENFEKEVSFGNYFDEISDCLNLNGNLLLVGTKQKQHRIVFYELEEDRKTVLQLEQPSFVRTTEGVSSFAVVNKNGISLVTQQELDNTTRWSTDWVAEGNDFFVHFESKAELTDALRTGFSLLLRESDSANVVRIAKNLRFLFLLFRSKYPFFKREFDYNIVSLCRFVVQLNKEGFLVNLELLLALGIQRFLDDFAANKNSRLLLATAKNFFESVYLKEYAVEKVLRIKARLMLKEEELKQIFCVVLDNTVSFSFLQRICFLLFASQSKGFIKFFLELAVKEVKLVKDGSTDNEIKVFLDFLLDQHFIKETGLFAIKFGIRVVQHLEYKYEECLKQESVKKDENLLGLINKLKS